MTVVHQRRWALLCALIAVGCHGLTLPSLQPAKFRSGSTGSSSSSTISGSGSGSGVGSQLHRLARATQVLLRRPTTTAVGRLHAATAFAADDYAALAKPVEYGPHLKIKGKVLNGWGLLYAFTTFSIATLVLPFMIVAAFVADMTGSGKRRRLCDWIVHVWANAALQMTFCSPRVYGLENLPQHGETVMYVPNHTSFVDILVLSGFVPRPLKYLSKSEIEDIPVIGWAMNLAKHVFLKRDDLKSTMEVTETCVQRLLDGNSMVLFAEGTRSPDGSLRAFKKGAFQMAKEAGVKVVPVSIANLHRWMPQSALLPLAPIRQVYIKIHPAIETKDQKISQIRSKCFEAVNSGLPVYQQHRPAATDKAEE